jgi:hypothetical protein
MTVHKQAMEASINESASQLDNADEQLDPEDIIELAAIAEISDLDMATDDEFTTAHSIGTSNTSVLKRQRSVGDIEYETPRPIKRIHLDPSLPITTPYDPHPQTQEHQLRAAFASPNKQRMFMSPGHGLGCWSDRRVLVPKMDLDNVWNMGVDDEPLMRYYRDNTSQTLREQFND